MKGGGGGEANTQKGAKLLPLPQILPLPPRSVVFSDRTSSRLASMMTADKTTRSLSKRSCPHLDEPNN